MTATAMTFPEPLPDDPDAVTTALETAAIFGTQGDTREAVRWIRRAAEAAGDEGNDMRALTLARVAADLTSQLGDNGSVAPSAAPSAPPSAAVSAAAEAAAKAAKSSADTLIAVPSPGGNGAVNVAATSDPALAPTVSAQPPADGAEAPASELNGASAAEPEALPPPPPSLEAAPAPESAAPAWVPPVPPPPPVTAGADAAPESTAAAPSESPIDSTRETTPGVGASQPPQASLRAALQRFSAQVAQSGAPAAQAKPSTPAGPDPTQSPALAALVQSIQQSPRPSGAPAAGRPPAPSQKAAAQTSAARPEAEASPAVDAAPNLPKAEAEPPPPPPPPPPVAPPAADPFSDAITDPRLVPAVEPVAAAPAEQPAPPALLNETPSKKAVTGARKSVRASIAATTEDGVFLVELLKDGQSPNSGAHEALIVLVDPSSDLFEQS